MATCGGAASPAGRGWCFAATQHNLPMMSQPERPALRPVSLPADWTPASWRERTALQPPSYPDQDVLAGVQDDLRALPPLVTSWEIAALKPPPADAQEGRRSLLQGGHSAAKFHNPISEE